jgi:hypothetical protein
MQRDQYRVVLCGYSNHTRPTQTHLPSATCYAKTTLRWSSNASPVQAGWAREQEVRQRWLRKLQGDTYAQESPPPSPNRRGGPHGHTLQEKPRFRFCQMLSFFKVYKHETFQSSDFEFFAFYSYYICLITIFWEKICFDCAYIVKATIIPRIFSILGKKFPLSDRKKNYFIKLIYDPFKLRKIKVQVLSISGI